jgi:hypothetical protein
MDLSEGKPEWKAIVPATGTERLAASGATTTLGYSTKKQVQPRNLAHVPDSIIFQLCWQPGS